MRTYLAIGLLVVLPSLAAAQTTSLVADRLAIAQDSDLSGDVGHPSYVSQLTRWLIDQNGNADFRYLFTDELRAKLFTADLESVLAGSQRVTKSFSLISQAFTCPAASGTSTLWVDDAPTFGDAAIFVSGDAVIIRNQTRTTFGPFTISDCVGVVTAYADGSGANAGQQSWTFTRNAGGNAGAMTASTVVPIDTLVQDMGVTGNGYVETTAVDGAAGVNAPYTQIITWATAPVAANLTVRARLGNLLGITGTAGEYGLLAGTYAATGGQYFRASNSAVELHGVNLLMWDGATNTIKLDRTAPSFALGSSVPTAYGTGTGIWMGKDSGVYKFRVGDPAGARLTWDGTTLAVVGTVTATSGTIGGWSIAADSLSGGTTTLAPTGDLTLGTGTSILRASSSDATYRLWIGHGTAGSAPFRVTAGGAVTATNATITGAITATSGSFTGNGSGVTNIDGGNITASTVTAGKLSVSTLSAITANLGTITAGTINGITITAGNVTMDTDGIVLTSHVSSGSSRLTWTDGSTFHSYAGDFYIDPAGSGSVIISDDLSVGGDLFMSPPTTTSDDDPVVYSTGSAKIFRKTNGVSATCTNPTSITIQSGIIVACS